MRTLKQKLRTLEKNDKRLQRQKEKERRLKKRIYQRNHQLTCLCDRYWFPHRYEFGKCKPWDEEHKRHLDFNLLDPSLSPKQIDRRLTKLFREGDRRLDSEFERIPEKNPLGYTEEIDEDEEEEDEDQKEEQPNLLITERTI